MSSDAPPPKSSNLVLRIFGGLFGLIAIAGGIASINSGIDEIFGDGGKVKAISTECDKSIDQANEFNAAATKHLNALLKNVDDQGLEVVRKDQAVDVKKAIEEYASSAAAFRQAADKLDEAKPLKIKDKLRKFIELKSNAYRLNAESCDRNQDLLRLLIDDSVKTIDDLLAKMNPIVEQREACLKQARTFEREANDAVGLPNEPEPETKPAASAPPAVEAPAVKPTN